MFFDACLMAVSYRDVVVSDPLGTRIFAVDRATKDLDGFSGQSWGILRDAGKGRGAL